MTSFADIESSFLALFSGTQPPLTADEVAEAREFFDVGEYGLALDTIIDIHAEENKIPNAESVRLMSKLAAMMALDPDETLARLPTR